MHSNWSYSPETPNLGQILRFLEACDLVIWRMTLKSNRAPFFCYFKLMHHFLAIGEFKLELQSGNGQFGSKSTIFFSRVTLQFDVLTLKNNRASHLCYFKLYASFRSHRWIQTGVTVRKRPIWVKIDDFFSHVTLIFDGWPSKTIGHLFYANIKVTVITVCRYHQNQQT